MTNALALDKYSLSRQYCRWPHVRDGPAGINLAQALQDQQQVHVPREGETNPPPAVSGGDAGGAESSGGLININTATARGLEALPGVGEVTAQRIIEHREANGPFGSVEDIQDVPGIGEKTFEGMEGMITVGW